MCSVSLKSPIENLIPFVESAVANLYSNLEPFFPSEVMEMVLHNVVTYFNEL